MIDCHCFLSSQDSREENLPTRSSSFVLTCASYAILMTVLHTLLNPQYTQRSNQHLNRRSKWKWVSSHLFMTGLMEQQPSKSSLSIRSPENQQQALISSPAWFQQLDFNCVKTQEKKVFCAGLVSLPCTDQCELLMSMDIILTMADRVSNSVVDFRKDYFGSSLHLTRC